VLEYSSRSSVSIGTDGRPSRWSNSVRHGAMNRSSSKNASIRASSAGSRLASSGSNASHNVVCGSVSRSTAHLQRPEVTTVSFNHESDLSAGVSAAQQPFPTAHFQGK
jgi:hypothetical protein